MAQHGYLREYDEGWDRDRDRDRGARGGERERSSRGSGGEWDHRDRNSHDRDYNDRNSNFMLGSDRDRSRERGGNQDRGFFDRMGDEARSWFNDDDRGHQASRRDSSDSRSSGGYGREHGFGGYQGDYGRSGQNQGGFGGRGDWERSPRNFSSHQDEHYRSWRDRQMSSLDQDYQDYCREREQQFHSDFDTWRKNRQSSGQNSQQSAQSQSSQSQGQQGNSSSDTTEFNNPTDLSTESQSTASPVGDATLGTNNSENTAPGRR